MKNIRFKRVALMLVLLAVTLSAVTGGTIAWFTDSVESTDNVIKSGTLDMTVEYKKDWDDEWQTVEKDTKLFDENALYEPGYTETVFFRVANAGNLAFKYDLAVSPVDTVVGKSMLGNDIYLSEYLEMGVYVQDEYSSGFNYADILIPTMFANRKTTLDSVTMTALKDKNAENLIPLVNDAPVLSGEQHSQVIALVLHMPTTVGNEANYRGETVPQIELGIHATATQLTEESDSFDNQYDADAQAPEVVIPVPVRTIQDLIDAGKNGGHYVLTDDLIFTDETAKFYYGEYISCIMADMTLDLNGHDIVVDISNESPTEAPVLFYVYKEGVSLTVIGEGDVVAKQDAFLFFPRGVSGGAYIYGGNYYNNDDSSGTCNDINAIGYSQTGKIHVYGGTFTFKNVNGHCGGFNVYDNSGAEIVLHEGVLLSNSNYYKGSDADEIHLAEGCTLEEVVIDGVTWYQVTKN